LLDQALEAAGIARDEVYVTNVVKQAMEELVADLRTLAKRLAR
jgi:uracil-DNA glycosylase